MPSNKAAQIKKLQDIIKSSKEIYDKYISRLYNDKSYLHKYKTDKEFQKQIDKLCGNSKQKMEDAQAELAKMTTATDVVQKLATGDVGGAVGSVVDHYLEEYAQWEGSFFNTGNRKLSVPIVGPISAEVGFAVFAKGELVSKRKGSAITSTATIEASGRLSVGIGIGVGPVSISAGVEGGPDITGTASMTLAAAVPNLSARLNPATLEFKLSASFYFDVPLPDAAVETVGGWVGLDARGNRLLYPIGSINALTLSTPAYSLTFDMSRGRFIGAKDKGAFSCDLHPRIKNKVKAVKDGVDSVLTELNPVTHVNRAIDYGEELLDDIGDGLESAYDEVVSWLPW